MERESAKKENEQPQGAAIDSSASNSTTTNATPQPTQESSITQATTNVQTEKKEELIENKEKLIDESGKIKMVG